MLEALLFSSEAAGHRRKRDIRGVPGLSQDIIFAISLEISDPTSFWKRKGALKKAAPLGSPPATVYIS